MRLSKPTLIAAGVVAGVSFLAFVPALNAEFVDYDDQVNFIDNPHYRGFSWSNLAWMFTNMDGHYIPVTWLTFALDYTLWGMDARGYHLVNLLFHAANALLFFGLVLHLLRRVGVPESAVHASAAIGALLFAVHPLRAESVAWVTERRDLVSGLFFLLSAGAYLKANGPGETRRARWLATSVAAFGLSLLSKTMGMGLPFVLLVLDAVVLKRRPSLRDKLPYFALFLAAVAITYATQKEVGTLAADYSVAHRLMQPSTRVLFYVAKTLLPTHLSPIYFWIPDQSPFRPLFVVCALLMIGAAVALWKLRRPVPALPAAGLAFGFLIAPVCGIFQAGPQFAADRYTYLACLPWAALAAAFLATRRTASKIWLLASSAVVSVLAVMTLAQSAVWKNSTALWDHAVAVRPDDPLALNNRGVRRASAGRLREAMEDFDGSLAICPTYPDALTNRARAKALSGDGPGAIRDIEKAFQLNPKLASLAEVRGLARMITGDSAGALVDFDQALARKPGNADVRYLRGAMRHQRGELGGAWEDYSEALRLRPALGEAWFNRGLIQRDRGALDEAIADFGRCVSLNPKDEVARLMLGSALRARGEARSAAADLDAAAVELNAALQLAPAGWPKRDEALRELDAVRRARR